MSRATATPVESGSRRVLVVLAVLVTLAAAGFLLSRVLVGGWPTHPFVADLGRPGNRPYATGFVRAALIAAFFYLIRRAWARGVLFAFARSGFATPRWMTEDFLLHLAPIGCGAMYLLAAAGFFYYFL